MSLGRTLLFVAFIGLLSPSRLVAAPDHERGGDAGKQCKRIEARLATVRVSENCTSPVGFCAAGAITGRALISGTTQAIVLGLVPSVGLPGVEPETTLSYAGERTIATSRGTLTLRFTGVFDTARGEASELERVTAGTGRFNGATGTLWLTATSNPEGTAFEGQLTGQLCLAR
jgi:hypothetical protein